MCSDTRFKLFKAGTIAIEQIEHVLLRAHRAFDAAHRIARKKVVDSVQRLQQLFASIGKALAERGGLRGNIVRAAGHDDGC
ncbi:unannotated protein [freshwater metagenome]|uniref:Unannotated protein n=1 Tax=freshwater metagenome TaxID=449393 RepID=A0A6J6G2J3_9ZZZZ